MSPMSESMPRPRSPRDAAAGVAARLAAAGHVALFAGGCVRDLLMGREPADYDVATDAVPARVCALFRRTLQVGVQFGVVVVVTGKFRVEVATFRSESGYADGRHPGEVKFSDARQDALRRDFTVNGMFLDPLAGQGGRPGPTAPLDAVLDYVGGRADLAARVIRAIGVADERFAEDHLRMLRAVRFAAVLGFEMESHTEQAVVRLAPLIADVSAERIWQEWAKVLASPARAVGWRLAIRTGLAGVLWPELIEHAAGIDSRLDRLAPAADAVAALACQFLPLSVAAVHDRCRQLALDNRRREAVAWLVEHAADLLAGQLDVVALKKRMADENWPRLIEVAQASAGGEKGSRAISGRRVAGGSPATESSEIARDPFSSLTANLAAAGRIAPAKVAPPPLIDGHDVMALGQVEGPAVGRVLAAVYDAQLADAIRTREEAIALARRLLASAGG